MQFPNVKKLYIDSQPHGLFTQCDFKNHQWRLGGWDATLCSQVIFSRKNRAKNRTKERLGQKLYLRVKLGRDWSTVLLYYKLTFSVTG